MQMQIKNDDSVVEALKSIAAVEQVKSQSSIHPDTGDSIYVPGYTVQVEASTGKPLSLYSFVSEKGQTHQVPGHRVDETVKATSTKFSKLKGE